MVFNLSFNQDSNSGSSSLESSQPQSQEETESDVSAEEQPLLTPHVPNPPPRRVMPDGGTPPESESATQDSQEAFVHLQSSGPSPLQSSPDNSGSGGDPTYAQPVLLRSMKNTVHPPATTEKTVYDDIQGFKTPQVSYHTNTPV